MYSKTMSASHSRVKTDPSKTSGSGNSSVAQHSMSPRLPRKSRQPGAYSSTSKLDNPGSLQVIFSL